MLYECLINLNERPHWPLGCIISCSAVGAPYYTPVQMDDWINNKIEPRLRPLSSSLKTGVRINMARVHYAQVALLDVDKEAGIIHRANPAVLKWNSLSGTEKFVRLGEVTAWVNAGRPEASDEEKDAHIAQLTIDLNNWSDLTAAQKASAIFEVTEQLTHWRDYGDNLVTHGFCPRWSPQQMRKNGIAIIDLDPYFAQHMCDGLHWNPWVHTALVRPPKRSYFVDYRAQLSGPSADRWEDHEDTVLMANKDAGWDDSDAWSDTVVEAADTEERSQIMLDEETNNKGWRDQIAAETTRKLMLE